MAALVSTIVLAGQTYPPPFPRPGAVKMLDNDRVQVWNVAWPKGQQTALHRHPYDMTGIYYAQGDRIITAVDGSKRPVSTAAGGIIWQFKGLTHIEEGTSDDPLRAVMIELKGDGASGKVDKTEGVAAFTGKAMPLLDNERVTVWDFASPAQSTRHRHPLDTVVVWSEGRAAHAVFMPAGTVHTDEQIGTATKATIFELK
jgi:quercetin dioxygenase-like cupin family protein